MKLTNQSVIAALQTINILGQTQVTFMFAHQLLKISERLAEYLEDNFEPKRLALLEQYPTEQEQDKLVEEIQKLLTEQVDLTFSEEDKLEHSSFVKNDIKLTPNQLAGIRFLLK